MDSARVKTRHAGQSDIEVTELTLGTWWTISRMTLEAGIALVEEAFTLGIDAIDTSFYWDQPHSQVVLGRILQIIGRPRGEYRIVGKLWYTTESDDPPLRLAENLDRSLLHLGVDHVDIALIDNPRLAMDLEVVVTEAATLVTSGRAKAWGGMMGWTPQLIGRAHAIATAASLPAPVIYQLKYSAARRSVVEDDVFASALDSVGATLMASNSLEGGLLAGRVSNDRRVANDPGQLNEEIKRRLPFLRRAASTLGVSPAQVAIAYTLLNRQVTTTVVGTSRRAHLREYVAALELLKDPALLAELTAPVAVEGHVNDLPYGVPSRVRPDFLDVEAV
jgi:aryl-alcohol dehydrogenase-like predicted oxidoreductase